jgi:hypothetical protein
MISGLRVPLPSIATPDDDLKIIEIELIGETAYGPSGKTEGFRRGVSVFPALEDLVYLATPDDLAQVYAPPREAAIPVGSIHQDADIPAYLLVNDLLGKHFSIVGTTGSGKSCAVATILRSVIERNPHAHVILLDPHCEYAHAFPEEAIVLSPGDGLHLPFWLFNFDELAEVVFGDENHRAEQWKILAEAVLSAKLAYFGKAPIDRHCSVDTPTPYRVSDLIRYLDTAMGSLNRPESVAAYQLVKNRMLALQNDVRFGFMFNTTLTLRDEMSDILAQLFRIPVGGKPITILDLSGVPSEVLNVVVSVICRLTFEADTDYDRLRGSASLRAARQGRRVRTGQARTVADRQGRPQIRRFSLRRQPATVRPRAKPTLGMQHPLRAAYDQPRRPGHRTRRPARSLARVDEVPPRPA